MAETRATINVEANVSQAVKEIQRLSAQYNAFMSTLSKSNVVQASAAKKFRSELTDSLSAVQGLTTETLRMRTGAAQLDSALSRGKVSMGQFFSARFRKDGAVANQVMSLANQRAVAMRTSFLAASQAMGGFRDATAVRPITAFNEASAVAAQKTAILRSMLRQGTTQMINFGKNVQWAGRQLMVGFTVPLTIFGGIAGKVFRDLEKEAVNFRKVYGDMFTTDEETDKALEGIRELSREFTKLGISASDTMKLAALAAQAGQRGAQLTAATTQATRLATLGDMGGEDAMRTTIAMQSAFKLSNEELADSINFLNMVENQTVLSLQDLAGAIPRVAPVIVGLGGDIKDMAVFLAAMREGGVSATDAANGLKSSLGRLIVPTKQAKEMAEGFGISLENIVESNRGDILQTVLDLGKAMESLPGLEKQQLLSTIFGKFQYARIGALFENIAREGSQASTVMQMMGMSMEDLAKTADKELKAIEESPAVKFTKAMEDLKLAIAPIGEMFVKMAIPVLQFLGKLLEKFNQLPDGLKQFIGLGTIFVGVIIPAATMMLGLFINLTGQLIKFGSTIGIALKGFTSGGFRGAINAVSQSFKYMSLAEIDTANAARQLASGVQASNIALIGQKSAADAAKISLIQYGGVLKGLNTAAMATPGLFFAPGKAAARMVGKKPKGIGLNEGGQMPGFGPNKDSLPAMLTPGEFVVNKSAAQDNLAILHAINDGIKLPGFMVGANIGKAAGRAAAKPKSLTAEQKAMQELEERRREIASFRMQKATQYERTHSRPAKTATTKNIDDMLSLDPTNPVALLGKQGLPVQALADDWVRLPAAINQRLRQTGGLSGAELKAGLRTVDMEEVKLGPAFAGKLSKKQLIDDMIGTIDDASLYSDRGVIGKQFGSLLDDTLAKSGLKITSSFDELRMPSLATLSKDPKYGSFVKQAEAQMGQPISGPNGLTFLKPGKGQKILVGNSDGSIKLQLSESLTPDRTMSQLKDRLIRANLGGEITGKGGGIARLGKNFYGNILYPMKFGAEKFTKMLPKGGVGPDAIDLVRGVRSARATGRVQQEMLTEKITAFEQGQTSFMARLSGARKMQEQVFPKVKVQKEAINFIEKNRQLADQVFSQSLDNPINTTTMRQLITKIKNDPDLKNLEYVSVAVKGKKGLEYLEIPTGRIGMNRAGNLTTRVRGGVPGGDRKVIDSDTFIQGSDLFEGRSKFSSYKIDNEIQAAALADLYIPGPKLNKGGMFENAPGFMAGAATAVRSGRLVAEEPTTQLRELLKHPFLAKKIRRKGPDGKLITVTQNNLDSLNSLSKLLNREWPDMVSRARVHNIAELKNMGYTTNQIELGLLRSKAFSEGTEDLSEESGKLLASVMDIAKKSPNSGKRPILNETKRAELAEELGSLLTKEEKAVLSTSGIHRSHIALEARSKVGSKVDEKLGLYGRGILEDPDINFAYERLVRSGLLTETEKSLLKGSPGTLGEFKLQKETIASLIKKYGDDYLQEVFQSSAFAAATQKFNTGGQVFDSSRKTFVPGVGDKDTVPAVLTPGEFVINKDATRQNKALLQAINSGMPVSKFNEGGIVFDEKSKRFRDLATGRFVSAGAAQAAGVAKSGAVASGAAGGGSKVMSALKFAGPMALSIPMFMGGQELGKSMGMGEMGQMNMGMASSMIPFMANMKILTGLAAALSSKFALITLPITALAISLGLTEKANRDYAKAGSKMAEAMTISTQDIQKLGETARQQSQRNQKYLEALETETIESEFAGKIAKAKTKQEKEALVVERDKLISERKGVTRSEAIDDFYMKQIAEAKKRGDSEEKVSKLYEQRNEALGKRFETAAEFDFEKTFGAQFLSGKGEGDLAAFRSIASKSEDPKIRQAELQSIQALGEAAYGLSLTTQEIAERDTASKLAQYILSGQMSFDQANSVADAIGQQEGDLAIGQAIKKELSALGGFLGMNFEFSAGVIAEKLAETDEKRIGELRNQLIGFSAGSFRGSGDEFADIGSFRSVNNFFSGMSDEFRRSMAAYVVAEANQIAMLQENISAVGLRYDSLIAKAKTAAEAESLRYDRTIMIQKLQKRLDEARIQANQNLIRSEGPRTRRVLFGPIIDTASRGRVKQEQLERLTLARGKLNRLRDEETFGLAQGLGNAIQRFFSSFDVGLKRLERAFTNTVTDPVGAAIESSFPADAAKEYSDALAEQRKEMEKGTEAAAQRAALDKILETTGVPIGSEFQARLDQLALRDFEGYEKATAGLVSSINNLRMTIENPKNEQEGARAVSRLQQLTDMVQSGQYSDQTVIELSQLAGMQRNAEQMEIAMQGIERAAGYGEAGLARMLPLMIKASELNTFKVEGGKTLFESLFLDANIFNKFLQDDELFQGFGKLTEVLASLDSEAQAVFLATLTPEKVLELSNAIANFKPKEFEKDSADVVKRLAEIRKSLSGEEQKEFDPAFKSYLDALKAIEGIKDPKIKLQVMVQNLPILERALEILKEIDRLPPNETKERNLLINELRQITQVVSIQTKDAAKEAEENEKLTGGGSAPPDPYQEMIRPIRQRIDVLGQQGKEILGASDKAQGLFEQARKSGLNNSILSYIRSLGPEEQIDVLNQVIKSQAKRNTLMKLAQEDTMAQANDALKVTREITRYTARLASSKVMSGTSVMNAPDLLQDEEFVSGMQSITGPKREKQMAKLLKDTLDRQAAERKLSAKTFAPMQLQKQIQETRLQQKSERQLGSEGFSEEQARMITQNTNLQEMINFSIERNGKITEDIIEQARKFVDASKSASDLIKEGMNTIGDSIQLTVDSLDLAADSLQRSIIDPLEDQLDVFRKQAQQLSEEQRRLNKALSDIGKLEQEEQERVQEIEEGINEEYEQRISALDKIEQANQRIADQQQDQVDLASALSRGDIAGAAKAQIAMQNRSAQNRLEDTKEGLRETQEQTIAKIREDSEEKIKGFVAEVNGQLLTREQIELRIDDIENILYQNSLKEWDIEQQITAEKEKQEEIQKRINKLNEISNIIQTMQRIVTTDNADMRNALLGFVKQQIELLGGEEGAALGSALAQNESALTSTDFGQREKALFDIAGTTVPAALAAISTSLNNVVPQATITAINAAVGSVNTAVDGVFSNTTKNLAELNKELDKDPFDKAIEGMKRFVSKIKGAFAAVLPAPGSGGGGDTKRKTGGEEDSEVVNIKADDVRMAAAITKEKMLAENKNMLMEIKNMERRATEVGQSLGLSLASGLLNAIKLVPPLSPISNFLLNIFEIAKTILKISSPSILFQDEIGKPIGQGILEGIKQSLATALTFLASPFTSFGNLVKTMLGLGAEDNPNSPKASGNLFAKLLTGGISSTLNNKDELNKTFLPSLSSFINFVAIGLGLKDTEGENENSPSSIGKTFMGLIFKGISSLIEKFDYKTMFDALVYKIKEAVKDIADSLFNIGKSIWASIKDGILSMIPDSIKGTVEKLFQYGGKVPKMAYGGKVNYKGSREPAPGMALGGSIVPGMGNTDRVSAMLMPGEYVVNKASTKAFLPLLEAMNNTKFPGISNMNNMPSIKDIIFDTPSVFNTNLENIGGSNVAVVDNSLKNNQYQINVNVGGSNASSDQIANAVIGKIRMIDRKQIQGVKR